MGRGGSSGRSTYRKLVGEQIIGCHKNQRLGYSLEMKTEKTADEEYCTCFCLPPCAWCACVVPLLLDISIYLHLSGTMYWCWTHRRPGTTGEQGPHRIAFVLHFLSVLLPLTFIARRMNSSFPSSIMKSKVSRRHILMAFRIWENANKSQLL